jgi:hypothetical protein
MKQKDLPFPPVLMRDPREVDMALIRMCNSAIEALKLQINLSGYTHEFIGSQLQIDKGHMSRIMSGTAHFPLNKLIPLAYLTGNIAFQQYQNYQLKRSTVPYEMTPEERIAELEAELAEARQNATGY